MHSRSCVGTHRLDRVDDDEDRPHSPDRLDDRAQVCLRQHEDAVARDAESARAHLDLRRGLLTRHIEDNPFRGERRRCLHQEGALADTGIAAEQHARPLHDPAAEHPVELADAGDHAFLGVRGNVAEGDRRAWRAREATALRRRDDALFDEGVPAIA